MTSAASASPVWAFRAPGRWRSSRRRLPLRAAAEPARQPGQRVFFGRQIRPASPRVVEDGEPVPRGGGQYLVAIPTRSPPHLLSERKHPLRRGRPRVVVRRRLPRPAYGQRRSLRHALAHRAHPTMPLRAMRGSPISATVFDDRARQRCGPYSPGASWTFRPRRRHARLQVGRTAKVKVEYVVRAARGRRRRALGREPAH